MGLNQAVFSHLSGYAGLTSLVQSRIYPERMKQGCDKPFVIYQRVGLDLTETYDPEPTGNVQDSDLIQFDAYGRTSDEAFAVGAQILLALRAMNGSGVNRAFITHRSSSVESDTGLFRVSIDAEIWNSLSRT